MDLLWAIFHLFRDPTQSGPTPSKHGEIHPRTQHKSELKKFASELADRDGWRTVKEGVEVKLARDRATGETVILCRSADRRVKGAGYAPAVLKERRGNFFCGGGEFTN